MKSEKTVCTEQTTNMDWTPWYEETDKDKIIDRLLNIEVITRDIQFLNAKNVEHVKNFMQALKVGELKREKEEDKKRRAASRAAKKAAAAKESEEA